MPPPTDHIRVPDLARQHGCKTSSDTREESSTSRTHSTLSTGTHGTSAGTHRTSAGTHTRHFDRTKLTGEYGHTDRNDKSYTSTPHITGSTTGTYPQPSVTHPDGTPDTWGGKGEQPAEQEVLSTHQLWRGDGMWTVEYPPNNFRSHRKITPWQREGGNGQKSQHEQGQDNSVGIEGPAYPDQKDRYQELLDAWSALNRRGPALTEMSDHPKMSQVGSTNHHHHPTSSAPMHQNYHHQQKQQKWQQQLRNQGNPSWPGNWPHAHLSVSQPQLAWPSMYDVMGKGFMAVDRDGNHKQGAAKYQAELSSLPAGSFSSQGHPAGNSADGRDRVSTASNGHLHEQNSIENMVESIEFLLRQQHQ